MDEEREDKPTLSVAESWKDQHDLERIYRVLHRYVVTYKDRQIPCDKLARLKAEGKTNEEIGLILKIPRGSVDYVWNQCRSYWVEYVGQ